MSFSSVNQDFLLSFKSYVSLFYKNVNRELNSKKVFKQLNNSYLEYEKKISQKDLLKFVNGNSLGQGR